MTAAEPLGLFEVDDEWAQQPRVPYELAQIIEAGYEHYRRTGFPDLTVPRHAALQQINALAATDSAQLLHSTTAYHVPDGYQQHRFRTPVPGKKTPVEQYERDEYLRHALWLVARDGRPISNLALAGALGMVRNAQLPAQFRPGFALQLMRKHAPEHAVVFDPSTGYGGRLVGFLASACASYIGVDPEPRTSDGNRRMSADLLGPDQTVQLIELPVEDVDVDEHEIRGVADVALSSPPYFGKERYSEDAVQSCVRYPTPERWRDGFLYPYMRVTCDVLKPGATAAINVADVIVGKHQIPLVKWTREAGAAAGLDFVRCDLFPMPRVPVKADRVQAERFESVLIFVKPGELDTRPRYTVGAHHIVGSHVAVRADVPAAVVEPAVAVAAAPIAAVPAADGEQDTLGFEPELFTYTEPDGDGISYGQIGWGSFGWGTADDADR